MAIKSSWTTKTELELWLSKYFDERKSNSRAILEGWCDLVLVVDDGGKELLGFGRPVEVNYA